jgi:hypothetical protein
MPKYEGEKNAGAKTKQNKTKLLAIPCLKLQALAYTRISW